MHKNERKKIRKLQANPIKMPEAIADVDIIAKESNMTRSEFLKVVGFEIAKPFTLFKKEHDKTFGEKIMEKFSRKYWRERKIVDKNLHLANLIHMELNNGMMRTFLISENNNGFYYLDKRYVFDLKMRYYDIDIDMHGYDFHEDFVLPFKRNFPAGDVKRTLELNEGGEGYEVSYSANPSVLERFINSAVIEMALNGGAIGKMLKMVFWFSLGVLILSVIYDIGSGFLLWKIYKASKAIGIT